MGRRRKTTRAMKAASAEAAAPSGETQAEAAPGDEAQAVEPSTPDTDENNRLFDADLALLRERLGADKTDFELSVAAIIALAGFYRRDLIVVSREELSKVMLLQAEHAVSCFAGQPVQITDIAGEEMSFAPVPAPGPGVELH